MNGRWRRVAGELALVLVVAVVAAATIARAPAKQAGDEANWLGTARFFLVAFVQHDFSAEAWPDSYWTRTQPMIPRYVMGGWLWLRGYDYASLDPNFDHTKKWFTNEAEGRAPSQAILTEARIPMRALTVLAAVLLYGVVRVIAGPVGGLAAGLLFSGSPYLALHMVRAMGEPPFIAFLLATMLVLLVAIQRSSRDRASLGPGVSWGILAGLLLGLAFASKLTAVIAITAVLTWGAWSAVGRRNARPALWAVGVVAVAWLTFVITNPFLYPDPLDRTWLLFANRQTEMSAQAAVDPSRAVPTLAERARLVWRNSLVEDTATESRTHRPIEAALAIVGFGWLLARAVRLRPGPEALLLLLVVGFFSGVTLGLGYVLDHYFVPTTVMGLILTGLTVGWSARLARSLGHRLVARRRHPVAPREPVAA